MNDIPKLSSCLLAMVLLSACSPASGAEQTNDPAAALEQKPAPASPPSPQFRVLDANTLAVGLVKVHKRERMLTLPATVNMDHFAIEYALVTTSGKTHESLLATEALVLAGSDAQQAKWLPGIADGSTIAVVAWNEPGSVNPMTVKASAHCHALTGEIGRAHV